MIQLNEDIQSSIIYQKALGCEYEFHVKAVTGNDYDKIDSIIKLKNPHGTLLSMDEHGNKLYHPDLRALEGYICVCEPKVNNYYTTEDLVNHTRKVVSINWKAQPSNSRLKVIFLYPETGMYITDQRSIVMSTLKTLKEMMDDENPSDKVIDVIYPSDKVIDVIYITNSPFIMSDITSGNLTVLLKGEENPKIQGRFAQVFAGNLYGITNAMLPEHDSGVLGDVCVGVLNNWIGKQSKEPGFDIDSAIKITNFVDDEMLVNVLGRVLHEAKKNLN